MSGEFDVWRELLRAMDADALRHEAINYRNLYEGVKRRPMSTASVSQKWLVGILTTIVLSAAAGWMTYVHTSIEAVAAEQKKQQGENAETKRDTAVIREKVERLERDVKEIKDDSKEQSKKLDELLRRTK